MTARRSGRIAGASARGRQRGRLPSRVCRDGALLDELTAVVGGARHEARFIVDEALAVGPGAARPDRVPGPARLRRRGRWRPAGRPGSRCSTCSATGPSATWTSGSIPVS